MELILWRHAEAEDGFPDSPRKLTDKGLKQAQIMAKWLKPRLPKNTRILVSPTKRTQQTAVALEDDFETIEEIGPGVSAKAFLAAVQWPAHDGAVLAVGHQPTLGQAAGLILSGKSLPWTIRKGAVWWFWQKGKRGENGTDAAEPEIILRAVISPEMV